MTSSDRPRLASAVVLRVEEGRCLVERGGVVVPVRYAPSFPTPHVERVSPGHRVAVATADDGRLVAVWRWYDAVVVGVEEGGRVRLWEQAHGEVVAVPRHEAHGLTPGARAYLSAGLPGAEWWVAGPARGGDSADVELDAVARLYDEHGLWETTLGPAPSSPTE